MAHPYGILALGLRICVFGDSYYWDELFLAMHKTALSLLVNRERAVL